MPDQLIRSAALLRLSVLCAALLIAAQITIVPASAAPASDDAELTVSPTDAGDEGAPEAVQNLDDEVVAPAQDEVEAQDEDEPASEPAQDGDAASAEPLHTDDEVTAEPVHADDEAANEPVHLEDEATAEPVHFEEAIDEPAAQPDDEAASAPAPEERAAEESSATAVPVQFDDEVADVFLMRLLDAINARRDRNGTQRLSFIPARANAALDDFLAETVSYIRWPGPCGHHLVDGAFSWDFVLATGFGGAPRGEVLACPGPEPYWTPDRIAEQWWASPIHFDVLYADGDASSIACSAYGVRDGANQSGNKKRKSSASPDAASAVLCVTFRG